jgi:hypothetical protein
MLELIEFSIPGRRVEALQPRHPTTEECFRNLAAAVLLQARKDLAEPNLRASALRWLHSSHARAYAEMLGIEPSAVVNLAKRSRR